VSGASEHQVSTVLKALTVEQLRFWLNMLKSCGPLDSGADAELTVERVQFELEERGVDA
jgi:hypothetical protein